MKTSERAAHHCYIASRNNHLKAHHHLQKDDSMPKRHHYQEPIHQESAVITWCLTLIGSMGSYDNWRCMNITWSWMTREFSLLEIFGNIGYWTMHIDHHLITQVNESLFWVKKSLYVVWHVIKNLDAIKQWHCGKSA